MKLFIYFTITCLLPCSLYAWGPGGHKVVALVAYEQLSTQQRVKVIEILKHPRHGCQPNRNGPRRLTKASKHLSPPSLYEH